ncbi:hypothetical protein [Idiomarina sp.]|uniref:hypothetical protein n=1 Tax=Idiomarina sp. TaxID=1874361 RepID=UPI003A8CB999
MPISLYTKTASSSVPSINTKPLSTTTNSQPASDKTSSSASFYVDLSPLVKELTSASEKGESSLLSKKEKIDESSLPTGLKDLLKRIAEYREKLKEKQQELQDVMNDSALSDEERKARIDALQKEISSYNTALSQAMLQLSETVDQMDLDDKAVAEVMSLIMS